MKHITVALSENYIGELRLRLEASGISLGELARTMDVDRSQVSRWFNTLVQPRLDTLLKIESAVKQILDSRANASPVDDGRSSTHELEEQVTAAEEVAIALGQSLVAFTKAEMWGGPSDGEFTYLRFPLSTVRISRAAEANASDAGSLYGLGETGIGDIMLVSTENSSDGVDGFTLEDAFEGKRVTRFYYLGK